MKYCRFGRLADQIRSGEVRISEPTGLYAFVSLVEIVNEVVSLKKLPKIVNASLITRLFAACNVISFCEVVVVGVNRLRTMRTRTSFVIATVFVLPAGVFELTKK